MTDWNYADVWETVADLLPDAEAIVQGDRRISWTQFDRRADGVARWLLDLGVAPQAKVALYLYNSPEYLEGIFAATKIGLVPVNTNYRYAEDELAYLWENADAEAVIFHGTFAERIEKVQARVPGILGWLWVDDGTGPCPDWAEPYEAATASTGPSARSGVGDGVGRTTAPWGRSGDDLVMLYTGGTTGMPKGVMWRQDDLFARLNAAGFRHYSDDGLADVKRQLVEAGPGMTLLPACPLMHGTGGFTANECLAEGGRVVLLASRSFDPVELLDTVEAESVNGLVMVGDPFGRPLLAALDAEPGRWDLSALVGIVSSGAMWSEPVKQGLLRHHPGMLLIDAFSSSEALGMGSSVFSAGAERATAEFTLGPDVKVLTPGGREVTPGSDEIGVLALGGRNPLGYYKDEAKTASTFQVFGGHRYSVPGDYAQVHHDGTIHLLGRGSVCINTAGEKVYPEEVEEVLKTHPAVSDAVVVGVPHERFGEQIVAAVELEPDGELLELTAIEQSLIEASTIEQSLIEHVKAKLASYKAPRRVRVVASIGRSPNGKVDYSHHRDEAVAWLGGGAPNR